MTDAELLVLLQSAASALDEEAAWIVDVDVDDRGRSKPSIPKDDREYFDAVNETAQAIRDLTAMVQARQAR
jgi:hypothetical protein